jgi:tRNA pseudouridine13 synthase
MDRLSESLALRPPRPWGLPPATGRVRACPEDFVVDEDLGFDPDGAGSHWLLQVRKRDANTAFVARELARFAGVRVFDVGYAGLKDRRAVTTQWFSVPAGRSESAAWLAHRGDGYEVLAAHRHGRKLPRGALRGNCFRIRVRDVAGDPPQIEARLRTVAERGVANYFGPQRFGRELQNLRRAVDSGARIETFALSAARSLVFNAVLATRVEYGTWDRLQVGDLANIDGRNSFFAVDALDAALEQRLAALQIHPTGPLFGRSSGIGPGGAVIALEQACFLTHESYCAYVRRAGAAAARRPLRLRVEALDYRWLEHTAGRDLELRFTLRSGSFATTVLREVVAFDDEGGSDD